ncbi:ribosome small subunit-dependent GTPase A [Salidesulfovibrio onnuriiensis]|uniref:ribosome small subunit-dependent GTPase A n=1 Tax=Salidesulfovibrio onnuriiensis TaxID=2583823 RepID=UPI0011C6FDDD|nr:ribosome small subunit-dependent GTPase A [Salidesulfovibrio onnuriiensis]
MSEQQYSLPQLGWNSFFEKQVTSGDLEAAEPARVTLTHRGHVVARTGAEEHLIPIADKGLLRLAEQPTVGDWLLLDKTTHLPVRLLERRSLFKRKAPGTDTKAQPIAANVDTLFIVSSCNQEFNLNRLERYLCLALDAGVEPVIVLTKADTVGDPDEFRRQAETLWPGLAVRTVNGHDAASVETLRHWCEPGRTVVLLGSSGVGKTTLLNTINGTDRYKTGAVREKDDKGRHTTTTRSLHIMESGALLVDVPGIRELHLYECEEGIRLAFHDIVERAEQCRFADCGHRHEPGCAVTEALESGCLDPRRVENFQKLLEEAAEAAEALAEQRRKQRDRPRYKGMVSKKRKKRK